MKILFSEPELHKGQFGNDFIWGVSTAAFQTEGAHDTDDKGLSIWDVFTARKGRIKGGHHAQVACNFYNGYADDITLLKALNIPNFRFSISWPRIMPTGRHPVSQKGVDYYNRLIDHLLENGIAPWVTLYHWDLPHTLELQGGWTNRDSINWFTDYVEVCVKSFGDRVKNWMVMNEPSVFTGAGYFLGIHAPGRKGLANYLKAVHHVTLSTAAGARTVRTISPGANIGTTFSCTMVEPHTQRDKDVAAANRVHTLLNRAFVEPILGMGYPDKDLPVIRKMERYMLPGDIEQMAFDFDFTGIQCYTREVVKSSLLTPYVGASLVKASKRNVRTTEMGWEVHAPSIYNMIKHFDAYPQIKNIIVTENGAAFPDAVIDGRVHDVLRKQYIEDHLAHVLRARNEGARVNGYFVWSLTDNFEWAEGYHARFGLVYIDFDTQQRIIKQSGHWFSEFLKDS